MPFLRGVSYFEVFMERRDVFELFSYSCFAVQCLRNTQMDL